MKIQILSLLIGAAVFETNSAFAMENEATDESNILAHRSRATKENEREELPKYFYGTSPGEASRNASITNPSEDIEPSYNLRSSLAASSFQHVSEEVALGLIDFIDPFSQYSLFRVSKYFHNLSFDRTIDRPLTIKSLDELKEMLASRHPSRLKSPLCMHLAFGQDPFTKESKLDAANLEQFLKIYPSLTCVALSDGCARHQGATVLKNFLINNTCLKNLNLRANMLFDSDIVPIAEGLSQNSTLVSLTLGRVELDSSDKDQIHRTLSQHSTLTTLTLHHLSSMMHAGYFLNVFPSLTSLHLVKSDDSKGEIESMCDALMQHTSLEKLSVVSMVNKIKSENVKKLSEAISQNSSLRVLDLSETEVKNDQDEEVIRKVCEAKKIQLKWEKKKVETPAQRNGPTRELVLFHNYFHLGKGFQGHK